MKKIALGLALGVAFAACDMEQEPGEANVGEEAAAETEQAMEEGGEAMRRAGAEVEMAFNQWDDDTDGVITEEEFDTWWQDVNPFDDWDVDADGTVTEEELSADFSANFGDWDADASGDLTEEEVQDGLFDLWDANDDQQLSEVEWRADRLGIGTR